VGIDGGPDLATAVYWFRLAANQVIHASSFLPPHAHTVTGGMPQLHADAQYYLGHCFATGEGVDVDYGKAIRWFSLAANQGAHSAVVACLPTWKMKNT
jgi:TPR repeat protein